MKNVTIPFRKREEKIVKEKIERSLDKATMIVVYSAVLNLQLVTIPYPNLKLLEQCVETFLARVRLEFGAHIFVPSRRPIRFKIILFISTLDVLTSDSILVTKRGKVYLGKRCF